MKLQKTLGVLNKMVADKVIGPYAMSGAVAAIRYLEPTLTQDLDILVSFESKSGLVNEGIVIEGWPVQFIPVTDDLDAEALSNAAEIEIDVPNEGAVRTRILRPEYLIAIALRTGRPKDYIRIVQFMESDVVDVSKLCAILRGNDDLFRKWRLFCQRVNITNPCG
jgi:hypothetical protein